MAPAPGPPLDTTVVPFMTRSEGARLRQWLYAICVLTDFAAFLVVFTVSRTLAEAGAGPARLGMVGGGYSLSAGVGSMLGGWLAHRFDGRFVFVSGAALLVLSTVACGLVEPDQPAFLCGYWLLGIGLGLLYPPLMGWLNRETDAHANRRGVSRTIVLFCMAWNVGMMCGQLAGGTLFAWGPKAAYLAAFVVAAANLWAAIVAARQVRPLGRETPVSSPQRHEAAELASAFKRLGWLANLGGMFGGSMAIHLLPDLAVSIGVDANRHGALLAGWRATIVGTYLLMYRATFWHYRLRTSLASQALGACGLATIACANSAIALTIGLAMLGQLVGFNYFSGLFYSTAGSSRERRTLAAGIHEATLAAGMALGSVAGGQLGSLAGHGTPYALAAAFMLVVVGAQAIAWRRWVLPLRRKSPASIEAATVEARADEALPVEALPVGRAALGPAEGTAIAVAKNQN